LIGTTINIADIRKYTEQSLIELPFEVATAKIAKSGAGCTGISLQKACRKRLQQLNSLRWLESGQVTRTSESTISDRRICLIYRMLVWYVPCSTEVLSSISIARHSFGGSSLYKNLSILLYYGKRYIVAILNRSSFEYSTRPAVTIRAGRTCYMRLLPKYSVYQNQIGRMGLIYNTLITKRSPGSLPAGIRRPQPRVLPNGLQKIYI
jgi:hypothetical protein